jgi:hypothetical protein
LHNRHLKSDMAMSIKRGCLNTKADLTCLFKISYVVGHLTSDPLIEGSNPAINSGRETMEKNLAVPW